jgi:hypothetical protein
MSITIHNYEAYLLDYMEGNLHVTKVQELHEFLSLHPELNPGEGVHTTTVVPENIVFSHKDSLKKFDFHQKITGYNFEEFCIAYYEGLLTPDQGNSLNQYCLKKNKEKDFECFGKTYLKPDVSITFPDKKELYKQKHSKEIRFIILQISAVAASVALFLFLLKPFQKEQKILQLAEPKETAVVYFHPKSSVNLITKKQINKEPVTEETKVYDTMTAPERDEKLEFINSLPVQLASIPEGQLNLPNPYRVNSITNSPTDKNVLTFISEALSEVKLEKIKKPKISLVHLFKAGINGINSVTDSDMKFTEQTDSTGNITVVSFESSLIKYHHYRNN